MFKNFFDSIERSGYINLTIGIILFICFAIAFILIGIIAYKSDKKK